MKKEARKLRLEGMSYREISNIMNIKISKVRSLVCDIKLSSEQISEKIISSRLKSSEERYSKKHIDKNTLEKYLKMYSFYRTANELGLTQGTVKYWCDKYNIKIEIKKRAKSSYEKCCICNNVYEDWQNKNKICNTCTSKLRRRFNKVNAINYLGGKCMECGYEINDNNFAAFEFHHDNSKDFEIGCILNRKWDFILNEVKKCKLLCSNCHRINHSDYINASILQNIKNEYDIKNKIKYEKKLMILKSNSSINENSKEKFIIKKEDLEELVKNKTMVQIGKEYNVSDTSVRKKCKKFGIDYKKISPFCQGS